MSGARRRWTRADQEELERLYRAGLPTPAIAERLGRTAAAVCVRASKTGVSRPRPEHMWTVADVRLLRERYRDATTDVLAERIGVTPAAVREKARQLGLRKGCRP